MKYTIPETMPTKIDFITEFMDAIFPDLEALKCSKTGYGYTSACDHAARETGLKSDLGDSELGEDSNLFRLMFEMDKASESIFGEKAELIHSTAYKYLTPSVRANYDKIELMTQPAYKHYEETLFSFCDQTNGSFKGWLKQTGENKRMNKSFEAALFFSFLLLSRNACAANRKSFFNRCLQYVGITDIEEAVAYKLFRFDWDELGGEGRIGEKTFTCLNNKAIILFGTVVLTIFEMIGTYSAEKDQTKLEKLYSFVDRMLEKDVRASRAMDRAEAAFFNSNRFFDPRSIQTGANRLYPQDFFVLPEFELDGEKNVKPLTAIRTASKSSRLLIMAKTGLGKSAFLQMVSLCMLHERYGAQDTKHTPLKDIAEKLNVPKDMYVISVPARMFSYCYNDERYQDWTTDLVRLFFNCMWKLSDGFNFYSTQNSQRFAVNNDSLQDQEDEITEELTDYVKELARTGKLLLILDSFDEIASGKMRDSYLKSLAAFCDKYCSYPEANEVGAHIIVSSRQMSPSTMQSLEHALEIDHHTNTYGICPLNAAQREELVMKWNRYKWNSTSGDPDEESREILKQIEQNHFYMDYSVNPYMLSVVCFYFRYDLGSITQRFINFLIDRMVKINRNDRFTDPIIMDVLMNIGKILQEIAGETVTDANPHFSRRKLNKYLSRQIDKTDLTDEDLEMYIERLHEIFVTQVGLIVPADGADEDYQFINSQIRFELAAKGILRVLEKDEQTAFYREVIFPSISDVEEYVGLLVPLLCDINLENVQLAELLVSDLAMYDFKTDADEKILLRTMLDLLLNRYGSNIATASNPGDKDSKYVRRAQRMLLMRVLTSRNFRTNGAEKEMIEMSPAFKSNAGWFSEDLLETAD